MMGGVSGPAISSAGVVVAAAVDDDPPPSSSSSWRLRFADEKGLEKKVDIFIISAAVAVG